MCVLGDNKRERETRLMRSGSLIKQRALQRGSLMVAPCLSSWVANPPSITAQPPAFFIRSSNDVFAFWKPISPWSSLSLSRYWVYKDSDTLTEVFNGAGDRGRGVFVSVFFFFLNADEIAYRFTFYLKKKKKNETLGLGLPKFFYFIFFFFYSKFQL